jgi:hypothetical protein
MCKNKTEVKTKKSSKDEVFYLRDYLGRSLSNCDRIEVDEHVNNQTNLKNITFKFYDITLKIKEKHCIKCTTRRNYLLFSDSSS